MKIIKMMLTVLTMGIILGACATNETLPREELGMNARDEMDPLYMDQESDLVIVVEATDAHIIRKTTGDIIQSVQGVPAQPVHSFTWDGSGVEEVEGIARLELEPLNNKGKLVVSWSDDFGEWEIEQTNFVAAPMSTGVRLENSISNMESLKGQAITMNAYIHGDSGGIDTSVPLVFSYALTWGTANVTLNGEPFINTLDDDMENWLIHSMVITGVYNEEGKVMTTEDGTYNPDNPDNGISDFNDIEFQLIFMDHPNDDMNENFPPMFGFSYHMNFEDVKVYIQDKQS